jgi:hypothetical protein
MSGSLLVLFGWVRADGQVGTETDQAKNDALAKKLWDLSVKVLKDKAQYDVKL